MGQDRPAATVGRAAANASQRANFPGSTPIGAARKLRKIRGGETNDPAASTPRFSNNYKIVKTVLLEIRPKKNGIPATEPGAVTFCSWNETPERIGSLGIVTGI